MKLFGQCGKLWVSVGILGKWNLNCQLPRERRHARKKQKNTVKPLTHLGFSVSQVLAASLFSFCLARRLSLSHSTLPTEVWQTDRHRSPIRLKISTSTQISPTNTDFFELDVVEFGVDVVSFKIEKPTSKFRHQRGPQWRSVTSVCSPASLARGFHISSSLLWIHGEKPDLKPS